MKQEFINLFTVIISTLTLIVMILKLVKSSKNLLIKEKTLYKDYAVKRFKEIEQNLRNEIKEEPYLFEGRTTKIIPRLEFEKYHYDAVADNERYKNCRKKITYYDENKMVYTWYIK